jgi:hypothetical protein
VTEHRMALEHGGDTRALVGLYEELRSWVLHPAREMPSRPRRLGQAVLLRSGMGEWMAAVASLQGARHHATAARVSAAPPLPTSTQAQLAAALASVVLARFKEEPHEP